MYNCSPVDNCLRHTIQVKHFIWNTLLRARRTKSVGRIPWEQPAHFVPNRLNLDRKKNKMEKLKNFKFHISKFKLFSLNKNGQKVKFKSWKIP